MSVVHPIRRRAKHKIRPPRIPQAAGRPELLVLAAAKTQR